MSKQPSPKADLLRSMREARYERAEREAKHDPTIRTKGGAPKRAPPKPQKRGKR